MAKIKAVRVKMEGPLLGLSIGDIPASARLVVLVGTNGSGKTSLLQGLTINQHQSAVDHRAFVGRPVEVDVHDATQSYSVSIYARNAYRAEHSVEVVAGMMVIPSPPPDASRAPSTCMPDQRVTANFKQLLHRAHRIAMTEAKSWTAAVHDLLSPIADRLRRIFPYLAITDISHPTGPNDPASLETLCFEKAGVKYRYAQLSAGEKEVFDLLFDLELSAPTLPDAVYCIDEPELHLHAALQAALLEQLLELLPTQSQLWIATHSLGIIRKAMQLQQTNPADVVFLNFDDIPTDPPRELRPAVAHRTIWRKTLSVAMHDLVELVCPNELVICEGRMLGTPNPQKAAFDARVYQTVFGTTRPQVDFISSGACNDIVHDSIKLRASLLATLPGVRITPVIDRDDRGASDISKLQHQGFRVLSRRSIENYLWSDEILTALGKHCNQHDQINVVLEIKANLLGCSSTDPEDPLARVKDICGKLFVQLKQKLPLDGFGNDTERFAINALAPLILPGTQTYEQLERDIFGGTI